MEAVGLGHLGLSGITIRLCESLNVLHGRSETILDFLENGEVGSRLELS